MATAIFNSLMAKDASFLETFALPSSASSSTQSTAIDFGAPGSQRPVGRCEFSLVVPELTATMVPNTRTVTYIIESSSASGFGSDVMTLASLTLTGDGAVIPQTEIRAAIPPDCRRYIRGKVTLGASTTDSSAITATFAARF